MRYSETLAAVDRLGQGVQQREHKRRKRTEGVVVKPRTPPTPPPRDPYYRDPEQIAEYQARAKSQFPDP